MAKFIYKAKKGPDEILDGVIEADSEQMAANKLMQSGYYPIWIKKETAQDSEFRVQRIRAKEIAAFTRQLSELLNSGLALYNALNVIENQTENAQLRLVVRGMKDSIKDGDSFSDSLKKYPNVFSNVYVNLVKSGEAGSLLNEVLGNIADFLDKEEDMKAKIIAALSYPILMGIVGALTIFILITFVVPKLVNMLTDMGQALPLPTRILIGLGDFIRHYWVLIVIFISINALLLKRAMLQPIVKMNIDRLKLKLPVFGNLVKHAELARFARMLSALLKNGVPVLYSLKITSGIIENRIIKEDLDFIHDDVKAGSTLAAAIKKRKNFPVLISNIVAVGEQGGFLDRMLLNIANTYEIELDRIVKVITSLLEPIFILIIGGVVGFIVIAMLLPIFQISLTAH
jgi:type II secretory pathway component PulF